MSRNRTYRPRTTRDRRDQVVAAAEKLNGADVSGLHEALGLLCGYLDVLEGDVVACPECEGTLWDQREGSHGWYDLDDGVWFCPDCDDLVTVWDYLDVDDPDEATLPGLPKEINTRFACDCESGEAGTNDGSEGSRVEKHADRIHKTDSPPWER